MAHVQRRCGRRSCRLTIPDGVRACRACGHRTFTYVARYRGPDHRERTRTFTRKVDAERFANDQESRKARSEWTDPAAGRESLAAFYERWRVDALAVGEPSPSTMAKYDGVWRLYVAPLLGRTPLAAITRENIRTLVASTRRKGSAWQAGEALKLIRMLLNRAMDSEAIGRNVAARISAPDVSRSKVRVLTPAEVSAVVEALPERWRAFVTLGAYSSLRWSELVAVKRDDIDLDGRSLRVDEKIVEVGGRFEWGDPKTAESRRRVDLPDVALTPLRRHLLRFPPLRDNTDARCEGLVFYGERGGPVRRHVFRPIWNRALLEAGITDHVRPEWIRHTGASLAYAASHDLKAVAERLGHTSVRMVDAVYVRTYEQTSRDLADAIDRLVTESQKDASK